jgi:tetratricopeptide (TPR) repeat protein
MSNSNSRASKLAIAAAAGVISLALSLPALAVDTGGGGGTPAPAAAAPAMTTHMAPMAHKPKVQLIDLNDARKLIAASDWTGAIKLLRQIVAQQPRNADALNLLGYSLRQHGDMAEAEAWYLKALKLKPTHLGANEYLGELYVLTGHVDKAKVRLATIAKICGNTSCEEYKDLAKAIAAKA